MTVRELLERDLFSVSSRGKGLDTEISEVFCCDLLSVAMGKAPEAGVWVTVMGNMNTLAVAELTEVGCIILAEGMQLDSMSKAKAVREEITVLHTDESIFQVALKVHQLLGV